MTAVRRALIGHTGFVGGTLAAAGGFSDHFNSRNFRDLAGQHFAEIVCAGVPGVKWLANREPAQDRAAIDALLAVLVRVTAERFVLISTVDVYPHPAQPCDEDDDPTGQANQPYGRHRLDVEHFVADRFPVHTIVRLPALFGAGLKKNALFDLLHDNMVDRINPAAEYQWYPTARLAADLQHVAAAGLRQVNLVTEPVAMRTVIDRFFPDARVGRAAEPAPRYALRTRHAALFGGTGPYVMTATQVLAAMAEYVAGQRGG